MTYVRTHTRVSFANPFLRCAECTATAEGFHDPERCGCEGTFHLLPCVHAAEAISTCPSWGPVDGCSCESPTADHRADRIESTEARP